MMEPLTIFAGAVAFIGIFHMLSTAVNKYGRGRNFSTPTSKENRSDWYCFFNISDLTGRDETLGKKGEQQHIDDRREELINQKRQQEARRPRLQA